MDDHWNSHYAESFVSRPHEEHVMTVLNDEGTHGPCASLLGPAFTREDARAMIWGDENKRAAAVWHSFYTRAASSAADTVFSLMGLLSVTVDPIHLPRSHYYLAAKIKLARLYLASGGRAHWMCLHGFHGVYQIQGRSWTSTQLYDDRICTFMRPDPARLWTVYEDRNRVELGAPAMGLSDDQGYLHIRTSAVHLPAGSWYDIHASARYSNCSFDIWLIAPHGAREGPLVHPADISTRGQCIALARHGRRRWHIFSSADYIALHESAGPRTQFYWHDMDVCIGGPNPVHDLFAETQKPWQEVNCVFREGRPVLLPIARRRPLGGGNEEDRSPPVLTPTDLKQLAVYSRDIPYDELISKPKSRLREMLAKWTSKIVRKRESSPEPFSQKGNKLDFVPALPRPPSLRSDRDITYRELVPTAISTAETDGEQIERTDEYEVL